MWNFDVNTVLCSVVWTIYDSYPLKRIKSTSLGYGCITYSVQLTICFFVYLEAKIRMKNLDSYMSVTKEFRNLKRIIFRYNRHNDQLLIIIVFRQMDHHIRSKLDVHDTYRNKINYWILSSCKKVNCIQSVPWQQMQSAIWMESPKTKHPYSYASSVRRIARSCQFPKCL